MPNQSFEKNPADIDLVSYFYYNYLFNWKVILSKKIEVNYENAAFGK